VVNFPKILVLNVSSEVVVKVFADLELMHVHNIWNLIIDLNARMIKSNFEKIPVVTFLYNGLAVSLVVLDNLEQILGCVLIFSSFLL
jgi:hypothetical protein